MREALFCSSIVAGGEIQHLKDAEFQVYISMA